MPRLWDSCSHNPKHEMLFSSHAAVMHSNLLLSAGTTETFGRSYGDLNFFGMVYPRLIFQLSINAQSTTNDTKHIRGGTIDSSTLCPDATGQESVSACCLKIAFSVDSCTDVLPCLQLSKLARRCHQAATSTTTPKTPMQWLLLRVLTRTLRKP